MDASSWRLRKFPRFVGLKGDSATKVSWEAGGSVRDPKRHRAAPSPAKPQNGAHPDAVAEGAAAFIRAEVAKSFHPIGCGSLANQIIGRHPQLATDWNGKGTFRKFAESLDVCPVVFDWSGSGGCAFDPSKSATTQTLGNREAPLGLFPGARQIHDATGIPLLSPSDYRKLFAFIEATLRHIRFT